MPSGTKKALPYKTIEPPSAKPLITVLIVCSMPLLVFDPHQASWVQHHSFSPASMSDAIHDGKFVDLVSVMFIAAFSQVSGWIWAANSFFIWTFGNVLEKQLKALRYIPYLLLLVIAGWVLTYVQGGLSQKLYIGPSLLLFGMLGGYFAFLPKKPHKIEEWVKPNTKIFRDDTPTPTHERYFVSPWMYIWAFVIYQVLLQLGLNFDKDFIVEKTHLELLGQLHQAVIGRLVDVPSAFHPVAAIMNIGAGFLLAHMLPALAVSLKPKRPGGHLQLEVIQHYRELRTLDLTHEQACEGAAKFASVPIDIAKDWISKGSAGLKDQGFR